MKLAILFSLCLSCFAQIHINAGCTPNANPTLNCTPSGMYSADQYFTGGTAYTATIPFPAGAPEYLRTSRGGIFTYRFAVPDGAYSVSLHFFESSSAVTGPAQRNFNVAINGDIAIPSLDLFAAAGLNAELMRTFGVTATGGGGISLLFSTITRNAVVSAIDIMPAGGSNLPSACQPDGAGTKCPGPLSIDEAGISGDVWLSGSNSGGIGIIAADDAGPFTLLVMPACADNAGCVGKFLRNAGPVACPKLSTKLAALNPACQRAEWAVP